MPVARPFIGDRDIHLIGKILSAFNDEDLQDAGLSPDERVRAEWMFDDINKHLTDRIGLDWTDVPVEAVE